MSNSQESFDLCIQNNFNNLNLFEVSFQEESSDSNQDEHVMKIDDFQLQTFKTQPCPYKGTKKIFYKYFKQQHYQGTRHNPKQCIFYHSQNDRRRECSSLFYSSDICDKNDKECNRDLCIFSHNKVEQLYHIDRYKTKFCSFYPLNVQFCDYAHYCSFAHNIDEIRIELLHEMVHDMKFYLYKFKTVWCPFTFEHNRQHCVYAHNPQDFRRPLFEDQCLKYQPKDCPHWDKFNNVMSYQQGGCQNLMNCHYCHGWKESDYHIMIYKTRQCSEGQRCQYRNLDCPFWHDQSDRRVKKVQSMVKSMMNENECQQQYQNRLILPNDPKFLLENDPKFLLENKPKFLLENKPKFSFENKPKFMSPMCKLMESPKEQKIPQQNQIPNESKFSSENNPSLMSHIYKSNQMESPIDKNQQISKIRKFNINSPVFIKKGFNIDQLQKQDLQSNSNISLSTNDENLNQYHYFKSSNIDLDAIFFKDKSKLLKKINLFGSQEYLNSSTI